MKQRLLIPLTILTLYSCQNNTGNHTTSTDSSIKNQNAQKDLPKKMTTANENSLMNQEYGNETEEEEQIENKIHDTRVSFPNFSIIIHNFRNDGEINIEETDDSKDTIYLDEYPGPFMTIDENTMFELLAKNKSDNFSIEYCYITKVTELFIKNNLPEYEIRSQTEFAKIKDSLNVYYKFPMPKDEDWARKTNGYMSKKLYNGDRRKIKNKFGFVDTLIAYSSEGGSYYASLKNKERLFSYDAESFLFRIKRFRNKELIESKYIAIKINYGC